MRVTVLSSGSSGNATLFASETTSVLVDAGIGPRVLEEALIACGAKIPDAIVLTHAHQDHVGEAARIAKRRNLPVYMTEATMREVSLPACVERFVFETRESFAIGDLVLTPRPLPHDAANVALRIEDDDGAAAIATDLGEPTGRLLELVLGCDIVLLESNYDDRMLEMGPYPISLRRRVASSRGHLSNRQCADVLRKLDARTHSIVLLHLSESNNRPDVALEHAHDVVGRRCHVKAAPPRGALVVETGSQPWRRSKPGVQLSLL
ncbi:MAG: MBL fold metallo-hydrolase [Polyangiales bacterium]